MNSTFTMANMCPQSPLLNKGFWAKLEAWLRFMHTQEREFEVFHILKIHFLFSQTLLDDLHSIRSYISILILREGILF